MAKGEKIAWDTFQPFLRFNIDTIYPGNVIAYLAAFQPFLRFNSRKAVIGIRRYVAVGEFQPFLRFNSPRANREPPGRNRGVVSTLLEILDVALNHVEVPGASKHVSTLLEILAAHGKKSKNSHAT